MPFTSREYDKKSPTAGKRLMSWISYSIVMARMRPTPGILCRPKERVGIVKLGVLFEIQIELLNLFVVEVDEIHVETHHSLQTVAFKAIGNADSVGFVADRLFERGQVLLMVDHLHVSDRGCSTTHDRAASSQQIACVSQFGRIDVGRWESFRLAAAGRAFQNRCGRFWFCLREWL